MASASSLYGVMKWLRRDEWNEAFSDLSAGLLEVGRRDR
jgi:hypothetical protein